MFFAFTFGVAGTNPATTSLGDVNDRNRLQPLTYLSLAGLLEIPQVGRRLIFLGRHQEPVPAQEIVFLADRNLAVALGHVIFRPVRILIRTTQVPLVDSPRACQGMID